MTTSGDHRCANNGQSGNFYIALEPGMEIIDPPNPPRSTNGGNRLPYRRHRLYFKVYAMV